MARGGANVRAENDCMRLRAPTDGIRRHAGLLVRPGDGSSAGARSDLYSPHLAPSGRRTTPATREHIGRWMRTDTAPTHTQNNRDRIRHRCRTNAFVNRRDDCKTSSVLSDFYRILC